MDKVGLVLEGGGMRGVYTSGVLDYMMEQDLYISYVIGVSAGSGNAVDYVSRQIGRSKKATIDAMSDPRYINIRNLFKYGSLLHMDLLFDEIPTKLLPFDFETFFKAPEECVIVATNCKTGKASYFYKKDYDCKRLMNICRASSSMPFISPIVHINGKPFLDGAIADSIPIKKSIEDGNHKNIIVLTRHREYRKKSSKYKFLARKVYSEYPKLQEAILNRYEVYNQTLDLIEELEKDSKVFVIRPEEPVKVGRTERDTQKLMELYNIGHQDAEKSFEKLERWLKNV